MVTRNFFIRYPAAKLHIVGCISKQRFNIPFGFIISLTICNSFASEAIFNTEGLKYLRRYLVKERKRLYERFIKEECQDYKEDTAEIRESYISCNKSADVDQIFVLPKSIMFYKTRCFPHHSLPYETDLNIPIPVKQLEKYLTDYGRKLLL